MNLPLQRRDNPALRHIRILHTIVWAVFATCILAIPASVALGRKRLAAGLIAVVAIEVLVLTLNRFRCPLTDMAARYTDDQRDNFDIYLPLWLARYNKQIFGTLYFMGIVYALLA